VEIVFRHFTHIVVGNRHLCVNYAIEGPDIKPETFDALRQKLEHKWPRAVDHDGRQGQYMRFTFFGTAQRVLARRAKAAKLLARAIKKDGGRPEVDRASVSYHRV